MEHHEPDGLRTTGEVVRLPGFDPATLERRRAAGGRPQDFRCGRTVRQRYADLGAFVRTHTGPDGEKRR
jgi:hypothetical protein